MADRNIENASTEVPEIPDELERVLVFALDEAKEKIEGGEDVIPFTTLVVKDNLFIESHPGDSAEECFEAAEKNVRGARGADCYAFCYDGYIETDDGVKDALIAEGGVPGADEGYAIAYLYEVDDEVKKNLTFLPMSDLAQVLNAALLKPKSVSARHPHPAKKAKPVEAAIPPTPEKPKPGAVC